MFNRNFVLLLALLCFSVSCSEKVHLNKNFDRQKAEVFQKFSKVKIGMTETQVHHYVSSPFSVEYGYFLRDTMFFSDCPNVQPCFLEAAVRKANYVAVIPYDNYNNMVFIIKIYYDSSSKVCCIYVDPGMAMFVQ